MGILPWIKTTSLRLDANMEEHVSSDMLKLSSTTLRRSPVSRTGSATMLVSKCVNTWFRWKHVCLKTLSVVLSFVVGRLVERVSGHPRPSLYRALGVLVRGPLVCHRVQGDYCGKAPTLVFVGVVTSCVLCARVHGHVSRSCATENTYKRHLAPN